MAAIMSQTIRVNFLRNVARIISNTTRNLNLTKNLNDSFNVQDTDDFKERVLDSSVPVIVDFHATWCGPCKMLGPRLESILLAYKDRVHLAKVDVDQNTDLAFEYDVSAVPVVIGIKDGKKTDQFIGLKDEDEIKSFVEKLIGPSI